MSSWKTKNLLFLLVNEDIIEDIEEYREALDLPKLEIMEENLDRYWGYSCNEENYEIKDIFEKEEDVEEIYKALSSIETACMRYGFMDLGTRSEEEADEVLSYFMDLIESVLDRARDY